MLLVSNVNLPNHRLVLQANFLTVCPSCCKCKRLGPRVRNCLEEVWVAAAVRITGTGNQPEEQAIVIHILQPSGPSVHERSFVFINALLWIIFAVYVPFEIIVMWYKAQYTASGVVVNC